MYVAAHMPDAGENEADDGKRFPSDLSKSGAIKKTADGFTYLDPAQFHDYFAADLSVEQAAFMAQSQVPNAADNFKAVITKRRIFRFHHPYQIIHRGVQIRQHFDSCGYVERLA